MEGGTELKSASTKMSEGKKSYSQAAQNKETKFFYRKISYNVGVVEKIHRVRGNAYARVSVRRGEELSLKTVPDTKLRPGDHVKITLEKSDGTTSPAFFGVHDEPVPPESRPLCRGRVKWFDKVRRVWTVKVRSSAKYLRITRQQ